MLDLKYIRQNSDRVRQMLRDRNSANSLDDLDELLQCDEKRRALLPKMEGLRHRRNEASKEVAVLKKAGGNAPVGTFLSRLPLITPLNPEEP